MPATSETPGGIALEITVEQQQGMGTVFQTGHLGIAGTAAAGGPEGGLAHGIIKIAAFLLGRAEHCRLIPFVAWDGDRDIAEGIHPQTFHVAHRGDHVDG